MENKKIIGLILFVSLLLFSGCNSAYTDIEKNICMEREYKYYLEDNNRWESKCYDSLKDLENGNYLLLSRDLVLAKKNGILLEE